MTAVGQDGELDAVGPPVLEERVDRRADRAAGVEDVVDEDHGATLELEVELRVAHERLRAARRLARAHVDVVAVEGDVELAEGELLARALLDQPAQTLRDRDAARVDADERDRVEILVALDDLVRDARERPADGLVVEQDLRRRLRRQGETSDSFPASRDRVKGATLLVQHRRTGRTEYCLRPVDDALLARYAKLIVEVGANVQPGQDVLMIAAPSAAPLVRAVAAEAYAHGARFVDPWYFDPT